MHRNLFLMAIMRGTIPGSGVDTLTDCGIFNSAIALRYVCDAVGLKGKYFVPDEISQNFKTNLRSDNFSIEGQSKRYQRFVEKQAMVDSTFCRIRFLYLQWN